MAEQQLQEQSEETSSDNNDHSGGGDNNDNVTSTAVEASRDDSAVDDNVEGGGGVDNPGAVDEDVDVIDDDDGYGVDGSADAYGYEDGGDGVVHDDGYEGSYYYDENGKMVYDGEYDDDGIEYDDYNDQQDVEEVEYGDYNDNQECYYPSDDDDYDYAGDGEAGDDGAPAPPPAAINPMLQLRPQEIHKHKDTKTFNRWYLQRRGTECYMPIFFEDGMDYTECELYYKSINSQLNYGGSITSSNLLREWNRPFETKLDQLHRITNRRRFSASSISSLKQSLMLNLTATNAKQHDGVEDGDNTGKNGNDNSATVETPTENNDATTATINKNNTNNTKQENFLLSCLRTPHPRRLSIQNDDDNDGDDDEISDDNSDDNSDDDDDDNEEEGKKNATDDQQQNDDVGFDPTSPGGGDVVAVRRNSYSGTPQLLSPEITSIFARSHSIHSLSIEAMDFSTSDDGDDDFACAGADNRSSDAGKGSATSSPPMVSPTTRLQRKPPARTKSEPLQKNSSNSNKPSRIKRTKSGDGLMMTTSRRRNNNQSSYSSYHTPAAAKKSTSVKFEEYVKVVTIHPAEDYPEEIRLSMWLTRQEMSQNMRRATMKQHKERRKGRRKKSEDEDDEDEEEGGGDGLTEERRERARERREARKKKVKKQREKEQGQAEVDRGNNDVGDSGDGYGDYESTLAE